MAPFSSKAACCSAAVIVFVATPLNGLVHPMSKSTHLIHRRSNHIHRLNLFKGIASNVDDDINREIADAEMSPFDKLKEELDKGGSLKDAFAAYQTRKKETKGDYENKLALLTNFRSYSNRELLDSDHYTDEPTLDDLNQAVPSKGKTIWASSLYRIGVFVGAFFLFPFVCQLLSTFVEIKSDEFDIVNEQFTPGIGILYGTFVALTLDILYERQNKVQENASVEASLLSQVTQNVLNLFRDQPQIAREASQIIADQVRIIVYRPRGAEMLNIMRADPYARLLSLIDHYQRDNTKFTPQQEAVIDGLRGEIPALMEARAKRLSDEGSSLPPTHFLVLLVLTALSLIGFTAAALTITDDAGEPSFESRMVFAALCAVYVLFYNFCRDMNDPFDGVYQIKRSSAASFLLQIKWLIASQPFGKDVRFDTRGLAPEFDDEEILVGKGDLEVQPASSGLPERNTQQVVPSAASVTADVPVSHEALSIENAQMITVDNNAIKVTAADESTAETVILEAQHKAKYAAVEAKMQSLKEKATGVSFNAKLDDGLYLVGCGVRKKAIINVYAVAMYSSPTALEALAPFPSGKQKKEAQVALRNAARTFGPSSPTTSFVLEMTFKADGKTIAGAIAESVKPRQGGSGSDVKDLENFIVQGVSAKGGQATKGTIFRFDCTEEGVSVSVDGSAQGTVKSDGIGSALVDVFMDDKAVSPQLVNSCLDTWCGKDLFVAV